MGLAIETVAGSVANPGAAVTAVVPSAGDTFTVKNFSQTAYARLVSIHRLGASAGLAQVRSSSLHDDTRGIRVITKENPSVFLLPREIGQSLVASDTLTVEVTGGTAETDLVALTTFYSDLPAGGSRLKSWGDISGMIKNIKPLEVAVANSATKGAWTDTVITTSEDLLHATKDYAVLGYLVDAAVGLVGVKGAATSNMHFVGGGETNSDDSADCFVRLSELSGLPTIPVFNAADKGGFFVSTIDATASTAGNVSLILAELSQSVD